MLVPEGSQRAWGPEALSRPSLGACSGAGEGGPDFQLCVGVLGILECPRWEVGRFRSLSNAGREEIFSFLIFRAAATGGRGGCQGCRDPGPSGLHYSSAVSQGWPALTLHPSVQSQQEPGRLSFWGVCASRCPQRGCGRVLTCVCVCVGGLAVLTVALCLWTCLSFPPAVSVQKMPTPASVSPKAKRLPRAWAWSGSVVCSQDPGWDLQRVQSPVLVGELGQ